jgi:serine/threonine-protein kinase RsbW
MTPDDAAGITPLAEASLLIEHRRVPPTPSLIAGPPADSGAPCGTWSVQIAPQLRRIRASIDELARRRYDRPALDAPEQSLQGVLERLALIVSELAGNALRHAQAPITVSLARLPGGWLLDVSDGSPRAVPLVGRGGAHVTHGRGLRLVLIMSTPAGWYAEGDSKHVWAVVPDTTPPALAGLLR